MYIVLVYDISIDINGRKRWGKIFKICKKYLHHIQNSVFEGELLELQIEKMKIELNKYLRKNTDSCIIFKSRNKRWMQKEFITKIIEENNQFI